MSYVNEANINPRHHVVSLVSSSTPNSNHSQHQQQQQQPTPGLHQPDLTNHSQPFDIRRNPAPISPPPYWPATSPASVMMTSRGDVVAPSGECTVSYQQQQQELRHADVTDDVTSSSPVYAAKIVAELVETERTYVTELQQIVQVQLCPSVRPSVTLMDHDHIYRLKITALKQQIGLSKRCI